MHPNRTLLALAAGAFLALALPGAASAKVRDFGQADGNNDGKVSSSEHEAYAAAFFRRIDGNHDDKITAAEVDAAAGIIQGAQPSAAQLGAAYRIRRHDTNGDGEISRTEFMAAAVARFRAMDANSNGELTPQEFASGEYQ
jgi:Ca2+-binding EF-hand superfamily protein